MLTCSPQWTFCETTFCCTESVRLEDAGPDVIWEPHPSFVYLETVCVVWFTIEYVLRITVAPNRCKFIFELLNIVDLIAILPFYLEIFLGMFGFDVASLSDIKGRLDRARVPL